MKNRIDAATRELALIDREQSKLWDCVYDKLIKPPEAYYAVYWDFLEAHRLHPRVLELSRIVPVGNLPNQDWVLLRGR